jgi:hypothetical protein
MPDGLPTPRTTLRASTFQVTPHAQAATPVLYVLRRVDDRYRLPLPHIGRLF